jgi:hypothetical protein
MRSSLFASVDVMEFQTTEAYSTLDLTNANNNNNNNNNNNLIQFVNNKNNNNSNSVPLFKLLPTASGL